jgi:hypothetical protein
LPDECGRIGQLRIEKMRGGNLTQRFKRAITGRLVGDTNCSRIA